MSPAPSPGDPSAAAPEVRELSPLVERAIDRRLAGARKDAAQEIDRLVEATYLVAARQGAVEPTLRAVLRAAGLSTEAFYRHFASKDELLLVVLADGRHRLASYLEHQTAKVADPRDKVGAWIRGVLAQAADPDAAVRTRPFIVSLGRLTEQFPEEIALSVREVVAPLEAAVAALAPGRADGAADAMVVYRVAVSAMQTHLLARSMPTPAEVDHLVEFCCRGLDA